MLVVLINNIKVNVPLFVLSVLLPSVFMCEMPQSAACHVCTCMCVRVGHLCVGVCMHMCTSHK